jgi:hypothetical protein
MPLEVDRLEAQIMALRWVQGQIQDLIPDNVTTDWQSMMITNNYQLCADT